MSKPSFCLSNVEDISWENCNPEDVQMIKHILSKFKLMDKAETAGRLETQDAPLSEIERNLQVADEVADTNAVPNSLAESHSASLDE